MKDDTISRQTLEDLGAECIAKRDENGNLIPLGSIDSLLSVSTEKTGRWEKHSYYKDAYICSACNTGGNMVYKDFKYCPNCGAKMEIRHL